MGARKAETFPIRILGLAQITVDHALQSRVSTSIEYQREFSEAMLRSDDFPAVTVFFDGKRYWLADGFHRYGARKALARSDPKFEGIKAEVRDGSKLDAIIFSAGANQKFSIPRTPKDIEKAFGMLFGIDGWLSRTAGVIAAHVGVSTKTVRRHRSAYCEALGIPVPAEVFDDAGVAWPSKHGRKAGCPRPESGPAIPREKTGPAPRPRRPPGRAPKDNDEFRVMLAREGVRSYGIARQKLGRIPGLHGVQSPGVVVTYADTEVPGGALEALGRLLCVREMASPGSPAVVVRYGPRVPREILEIAGSFGVEFMTAEEFAAGRKGSAESA